MSLTNHKENVNNMESSKYGVHAGHCCVIHGCKYGDSDCPVVNKKIKQHYLCEECNMEGITNLEFLQKIAEAKFNIGDVVIHYKFGKGEILGNYHKRLDGKYYWHIRFDDNTFGYARETALKLVKERDN